MVNRQPGASQPGAERSRAAEPVAMATPAGAPERDDKAKGLELLFSLSANVKVRKVTG